MSKLFVYFSYTGNGDLVAEKMATLGYDVRRVVRKKPLPRSFFFGVLTGGFLALTKHKDSLVDFDADISSYDEIVIGSPVWNGRLSSPINTAISLLDLSGKTLSFLLYAGGGTAPAALKRIAKEYPSARTLVLKQPKKFPEELDKLKEF